jgi:glycosyltransferase involved in cell wall biosynthesis
MLESFLRTRKDYYATIIVSRPHNMELLGPILTAHPDWFENIDVIYDAEALFAAREVGLRKLSGKPMTQEEERKTFADEIQLASKADRILAVSEGERASFAAYGVSRVDVLGHSLPPKPFATDFSDRTGLLFVGAVHQEDSPNCDSLIWFLTDIYPRIRASLGDIAVTIAGVNRSERLQKLATGPVRITGHLPSLDNLYSQTRVFIAPTRYAAGIPHKVHEAAAYGLPVVATPILAAQLGWSSRELGIGETAEEFAERCIEIYRDARKWSTQRDAALDKIRSECSPEGFEEKIRQILQ